MGSLVLPGGFVTWIFVSDGVRDVTFGMAFQLLPLYMQNLMGLSNVEISWLSSLSSLVTMLFLTPAGWLADRRGERLGIWLTEKSETGLWPEPLDDGPLLLASPEHPASIKRYWS